MKNITYKDKEYCSRLEDALDNEYKIKEYIPHSVIKFSKDT